MATKSTKPEKTPQSPAQAIQAKTESPPGDEETLAVTLRADNSFEYHLELPRSVVAGILDPDVPDVFIEVPCLVRGSRRFLHTAYVKEIDVRGM